jgi:hypothetical protein
MEGQGTVIFPLERENTRHDTTQHDTTHSPSKKTPVESYSIIVPRRREMKLHFKHHAFVYPQIRYCTIRYGTVRYTYGTNAIQCAFDSGVGINQDIGRKTTTAKWKDREQTANRQAAQARKHASNLSSNHSS